MPNFMPFYTTRWAVFPMSLAWALLVLSQFLSITKMTFSLKHLMGLFYVRPFSSTPLENPKSGHYGSNPGKPSSTSAYHHNVLHTMQVDVAGCICSSIWHVSVALQQRVIELTHASIGPKQFAQELLSTFETAIGEVALTPATGGLFTVELVGVAWRR
jgi:hypothetical protein